MNDILYLKEVFARATEALGMPQKEIARQVFGDTANNLNNKIRIGSARLHVLIKYAAARDVDLTWLLTGDGGKQTDENEMAGESLKTINRLLDKIDRLEDELKGYRKVESPREQVDEKRELRKLKDQVARQDREIAQLKEALSSETQGNEKDGTGG